jgi:uncharacterized protein with PQ loop repeat
MSLGQACLPEKDGHHYWELGQTLFADCVYSIRDYISLGIGLLSICIWLVALVPQAIENLRTGKVEGQSVWLWVLWLIGDSLNLIGCLLAHQLPSQTFLAIVYMAMTLVLFFQFIYYTKFKSIDKLSDQVSEANLKATPALGLRSPMIVQGVSPLVKSVRMQNERRGRIRQSTRGRGMRNSDPAFNRSKSLTHSPSPDPRGTPNSPAAFMFTGLGLLMMFVFKGMAQLPFASSSGGSGRVLLESADDLYGSILGWTMTLVYFSSRFPQMLKMIQNQQIEGVSKSMFIMTFSGNFTYCAAVLIRSTEWSYISSKLPWLVDGFGTMMQDLIILIVYTHLERKHKKGMKREDLINTPPDEKAPLLSIQYN